MAYNELIKNFERVRAYIREFYLYGFKSRSEYDAKSARSYDNERRRVESWLGGYLRAGQTARGKNVFLSVDSRATRKNPFYKAWKAKSFTDGDITLHFAIFDILYEPAVQLTLSELLAEIDRRLASPVAFDPSTLRKKLKEYVNQGIIRAERRGRQVVYSRSPDTSLAGLEEAVDFFSEAAPCGVVGSFLQDRLPDHEGLFWFKHHYITQAMDSEVMAALFAAMAEGRYVTADNLGRRAAAAKRLRLVPLKIYISAQNGRQHLIAYLEEQNQLRSYRLDHLSHIRPAEPCGRFEALRGALARAEGHMWGVNCRWKPRKLERVEFDLLVGPGEGFILRRLEREKRCGRVEKLDETHYRYSAEVFDTAEMIPWIRTFICRITRLNFSNRSAENQFRADLQRMYRAYGLQPEEEEEKERGEQGGLQ